MGIIKAFTDSLGGTLGDQWKDIITAGDFDEKTLVSPGVLKSTNNGRGVNFSGSQGVITNGSRILVPENTVAYIFSQSGIEDIITEPGEFIYKNGEDSVFNGDSVSKSIFGQVSSRIGYGGIAPVEKIIAFVNLREIRNINFGTRGPQVYNDIFYGCDLEIFAYGAFTIKVTDATKLIKNFLPANTQYYTFHDKDARAQIVSDFLQSFTVALNSLSKDYRISHVPSKSNELAQRITSDKHNAGTWAERFGFEVVKVSIENIEMSQESRELVNQFNANKMNLKAYEDVSQQASNISAQQKIAKGVQNNGFGDMGGMIFGMNMAQSVGLNAEQQSTQTQHVETQSKQTLSIDEQIESLKKLKELVDIGVLTPEEFDIKKKEIMGI